MPWVLTDASAKWRGSVASIIGTGVAGRVPALVFLLAFVFESGMESNNGCQLQAMKCRIWMNDGCLITQRDAVVWCWESLYAEWIQCGLNDMGHSFVITGITKL